MEPVAAHALAVERLGQRIPIGHLGMGPVERGVEAGHLGDVGQAAGGGLQGLDLGRQVERRERDERAELGQQAVVDERRPVVRGTAVDDPVTDHVQRPACGETVQRVVEGVGRRIGNDLDRAPVDGLLDAVAAAVERVLERGRAAVQAGDQVQSLTSGMSSRCSTT